MATGRRAFIFDGYLKGVKDFITKYHEMIHRAAGYQALRMHLLVSLNFVLSAARSDLKFA